MFKTLRAAFAINAHKETWDHIKQTMIDVGIQFPLQFEHYLPFVVSLNTAHQTLPYAPWTKVDYGNEQMMAALYMYIESDLKLDLQKVVALARIQQQIIEDNE